MFRGELSNLVEHHQQAAAALAREQGVLLHFLPYLPATHGSRDRLEPVVETIEHEVLRAVEESFRTPAGDRVLQDVSERGPQISAPDEADREHTRFEQRRPQVGNLLDRRVLRREAAMRIQEQMLDRC